MFTTQFLKELIVVGLSAVIVGLVVTWIVMQLTKSKHVAPGGSSKEHWLYCALIFFITGVLLHLIYEAAGWNKWYCKHGNACRS
jgi:type VI protein secretion system component VasK